VEKDLNTTGKKQIPVTLIACDHFDKLVILEKLVKKIPAHCRTERFITVFTTAYQLCL